jgi:hypothetical protein
MKKVVYKSDLKGVEARAKAAKNSLIVMGRSKKKLWVKNLELEGVELKFDPETEMVTMSFPLRQGEFLAIQDEQAMAEQKELG